MRLLTRWRHNNGKRKLARDVPVVKCKNAVFPLVTLLSYNGLTCFITPLFAYEKVTFKSVKSLNIVTVHPMHCCSLLNMPTAVLMKGIKSEIIRA